jgi:hypothetical protein
LARKHKFRWRSSISAETGKNIDVLIKRLEDFARSRVSDGHAGLTRGSVTAKPSRVRRARWAGFANPRLRAELLRKTRGDMFLQRLAAGTSRIFGRNLSRFCIGKKLAVKSFSETFRGVLK